MQWYSPDSKAVFTKALAKKDEHVLVTGIGGGVALAALQFAVAVGAHVYMSHPPALKRSTGPWNWVPRVVSTTRTTVALLI